MSSVVNLIGYNDNQWIKSTNDIIDVAKYSLNKNLDTAYVKSNELFIITEFLSINAMKLTI